jgi:hypothetical protein
MNFIMQLSMEQLRGLMSAINAVSAELKSGIIVVSSGLYKTTSELKTDILVVEVNRSATQEQRK